jgi:hypothetical protein
MDWAGLEFDPRVVQVFLSLGPFEELRSYAKESQESGVWSPESTASAEDSDERQALDASSAPDSSTAEQAAEPALADSSSVSSSFDS